MNPLWDVPICVFYSQFYLSAALLLLENRYLPIFNCADYTGRTPWWGLVP